MPQSASAEASRIVLIVDDAEDTLQMLEFALRLAGYRVLLARDALQALDLLAAQPCDAVITDFHMPQMNGAALIARLRAMPQTRHLPVLLMSCDESSQQRGAPADAYLQKPFDLDRLYLQLQLLLDAAPARAQAADPSWPAITGARAPEAAYA